ncbi:MAG: hypothetical protein HQM09_18205 [Candidatus Riflebacteria bacterium]|nr:hypothetical protein [Candidatus Riflebacteria bacterium]
MKKSMFGALTLVVVLLSFALVSNVALALKNVCPNCNKMIDNQELNACPFCGKIINKCLICGYVNPIKNDNCASCSANLAESRVSRTIDKETRTDLKLGESPLAQIAVELAQIDHKVVVTGLTPELAARQVELLSKMGWWSLVNTVAMHFATQYPNSDQNTKVAASRVIALRNLAFLALSDKNNNTARDYINTALSIDPKDKECLNLQKVIGEAEKAAGGAVKVTSDTPNVGSGAE